MSENKNSYTKFMIMKKLYKDGNKQVYLLSNKNGYKKGKLSVKQNLNMGEVIEVEDSTEGTIDISDFEYIKDFNLEDYLASVKRPINDIMADIEEITKECIISEEGKILNDYFFNDEKFLEEFKHGIGGVSMHHNYIGGLAEHTLNVMYLTKVLCDRGPFKYTLQGELEGHIVIGVQMIDKALNEIDYPFSEDFIRRIKGCITQHHGKLEYGSPKACNMEESFILNYADTVDATMNKIEQIKENTKEDTWSDYDRRIETKLYL